MKEKAPRNRTLEVTDAEQAELLRRCKRLQSPAELGEVLNRTICQDMMSVVPHLPRASVDLLVLDPPYNLAKDFHGLTFTRKGVDEYTEWMRSWFNPLLQVLKPSASVYVCGDWLTSASIYQVLAEKLSIRNRIVWEREKGRGAKTNWKNCSEDIWFATVGDSYFFDADAVKLKRKVLAPYRVNGKPKDWDEGEEGNFRLTNPSNFWSDISIPFWSMPENTEHPTQKPEKLIAKLVLASSRKGDVVLDPFLGSGTTSVVCKKLDRHFVGIESNERYCAFAEKRLIAVESDNTIQGYSSGAFWERNTLAEQLRRGARAITPPNVMKTGASLFAAVED